MAKPKIPSLSDLAEIGRKVDSWYNALTGLGTIARDRAANNKFCAGRWLLPTECADLYHHDDICHRLAEIYPSEALRQGVEVEGPAAEALKADFERLDLVEKIEEGEAFGRAMGGALGVLWFDDGRPPSAPLDKTRRNRIRCIDVHDNRWAQRVGFFEDPDHKLYGETSIYRVTPEWGGITFDVHRDRCLVFRGRRTSTCEREMLLGWDASIYQIALEVIQQFAGGFMALANMLSDASQTVVTIKGLLGMLSMTGGQDLMAVRAQMFDLTRGVSRAVWLDADKGEQMTKLATSFAQVPESLDRLGQRLAATYDIPVTRLLGTSPAGLNATGESDRAFLYDGVKAYQGRRIKPHFDQVIRIECGPDHGNTVKFPSLWQATDKEKSETDKTTAETLQILIENQVITPEEAAESISRGVPIGSVIDLEARKRKLRQPRPTPRQALPGPQGEPPALPPGGAPPALPPGPPKQG